MRTLAGGNPYFVLCTRVHAYDVIPLKESMYAALYRDRQ